MGYELIVLQAANYNTGRNSDPFTEDLNGPLGVVTPQ